jgi:hypothetical protein
VVRWMTTIMLVGIAKAGSANTTDLPLPTAEM